MSVIQNHHDLNHPRFALRKISGFFDGNDEGMSVDESTGIIPSRLLELISISDMLILLFQPGTPDLIFDHCYLAVSCLQMMCMK
jgi:hypothetical protein